MRPDVGDLKEFFHITDDSSTQVCLWVYVLWNIHTTFVCVRAACARVCVHAFHNSSVQHMLLFTTQVWPANHAPFKTAMQELYSSMHQVAFIILECMARALKLEVCVFSCSEHFVRFGYVMV